MNEKYIELEIPNEWGEYLYNLLNGLEKERELHWMINYSEILEKKGNDFPELLEEKVYKNDDLFKKIKTVCYVIQLDIYAYCKERIEVMHLRISDSSYVEIWMSDKYVFDKFIKGNIISDYLREHGME
ncbi:hypothetical protein SAMN05216584_1158 [Selenomonas sp. WCT3]|uniref:hypothetical protein n=1 Tax=Selenomonas sp. WCT3 TaxID=3158785 RepID=UPI00088E040D|nr:hypothetical protein SAMN05216584_1158 [Selenomonas ruminantium]